MDTHAILCRLVEPLNRVAYGHVLVERVKEGSRKDVDCSQHGQSLHSAPDASPTPLHRSS